MSTAEFIMVGLGITLHILVLSALLRGPVREMPFFFCYVVVVLLATVVETTAAMDQGRGLVYARYYWISELLSRGLLFATLLQMLTRAWQAHTPGSRRGGLVTLVVMAATALSLTVNYTTPTGRWMTLVTRDLNFASALLNVLLWVALLRVRTQRTALLVVSALGIQMTGAAIGHSLRYLSRETVIVGNYTIVISHLLCFFVCWRALSSWHRVSETKVSPAILPHVSQTGKPAASSVVDAQPELRA